MSGRPAPATPRGPVQTGSPPREPSLGPATGLCRSSPHPDPPTHAGETGGADSQATAWPPSKVTKSRRFLLIIVIKIVGLGTQLEGRPRGGQAWARDSAGPAGPSFLHGLAQSLGAWDRRMTPGSGRNQMAGAGQGTCWPAEPPCGGDCAGAFGKGWRGGWTLAPGFRGGTIGGHRGLGGGQSSSHHGAQHPAEAQELGPREALSTVGASQGPGTRQNMKTEFLPDTLGRGRTGGLPPGVGQGRGGAQSRAGCRSDAGAAQGGAAQRGRWSRVSSLLVDLGQQQDEGHGQGTVVEAVDVGVVPLLQGRGGPSAVASALSPKLPPHCMLCASASRLAPATPQPPRLSWESGPVTSSKRLPPGMPLGRGPSWRLLPPPPPPGYLEEEAEHQGQGPEAEAGAYLLGVDALVGVQTLFLLHLPQLRGQRRRESSEVTGHARPAALSQRASWLWAFAPPGILRQEMGLRKMPTGARSLGGRAGSPVGL